jgi:hypothetical protein
MAVNAAEVIKSIDRERANIEWINKSLARLREEFGGRYVAVRDRKVIDSDKDFEALLRRIRKQSNPESVTIEFISNIEYLWML